MSGYCDNIEQLTLSNTNFRQVLYTGKHAQLVVMSLLPGEEIGSEVHEHVDQFFRIESGNANVSIDGAEYQVKDGFAIVVPAGSEHNVKNISKNKPLKLYTLYSPPNHPDGTVHKTKAEADAVENLKHD